MAEENAQESAATSEAGGDTGGDAAVTAVALPEFENGTADGAGRDLDLLDDVDLTVTVELGRTRMYVEDVLRLNESSVVELEKAAGDPVDIFVNGRHVARGEVLVLNDNFCVRVNEIIEHVDLPA